MYSNYCILTEPDLHASLVPVRYSISIYMLPKGQASTNSELFGMSRDAAALRLKLWESCRRKSPVGKTSWTHAVAQRNS